MTFLGMSSPLEGITENPEISPCGRLSQHESASRRKHVYEMATLLGWGEGDYSWCLGEGYLFPEWVPRLRYCALVQTCPYP